MFACIHSPQAENLRELADAFSPWVEEVAPDTVLFSLDGLHRIYGDARSTAEALAARAPNARIAIAALPDTAVLAARNLPGVVVIPQGQEMRYLGPLPLDCLPLDSDIWKILDRWGLRTFEDLACLPENGLHDRLGDAGVRLQAMARGALGRPLKPVVEETVYEQSIELDDALELLEPILFLLAQFLNKLCADLKAQSLAAGELLVTLNRAQRILRLPFPTRDVKFLLKQLQHNLESQLPGEPVSLLTLRVVPTATRLVQHDLFTIPAPEPERLESTLQKIRAMVGAKNVKIPEIRNTHRPGWGPAETKLAFRHFRPPLEARLETESGQPSRVRASSIQGTVAQVSGPWRTSGEWWRADAWDRDEFDLVLSDGAVYRICFHRQSRKWQLEGVYD
jgi:protein ImuB